MVALCREQVEKSSMALVDWEALAKVDGLELNKWRQSLKADMCSVSELCCRLREKVRELELERDAHKMMVGKLESEIEQLSSQMDSLQVHVQVHVCLTLFVAKSIASINAILWQN